MTRRPDSRRFIVLVRDSDLDWRAFGVYRTFASASRDANAWNNAIVLPVEDPDARYVGAELYVQPQT